MGEHTPGLTAGKLRALGMDAEATALTKERLELLGIITRLEGDKSKLVKALAFAASVIKSGEPWTETCEREIGGLLAKIKGED